MCEYESAVYIEGIGDSHGLVEADCISRVGEGAAGRPLGFGRRTSTCAASKNNSEGEERCKDHNDDSSKGALYEEMLLPIPRQPNVFYTRRPRARLAIGEFPLRHLMAFKLQARLNWR